MNKLLSELNKYLELGSRLDVKDYAIQEILNLTGNADGLDAILQHEAILCNLIILLYDNNHVISKQASLVLVNLSANANGSEILLNLDIENIHKNKLVKAPKSLVESLLDFILNKSSRIADFCCMILSNLTRHAKDFEIDVKELIEVFTKRNFNEHGAHLNYLGPVLSNLTQFPQHRLKLLQHEQLLMNKLLVFVNGDFSLIRRGGVIGALRNCCFEVDYHRDLLGNDEFLPALLLPLAGGEEYDDEDNEKLPLELQYLPEDKKREEDPDLRCMLLEALTQLCARRENREWLRSRNVYVIVRELHKWETDDKALKACENLVDILIRTEDEIGEDDLKQLDIPQDLHEKLDKLNVV